MAQSTTSAPAPAAKELEQKKKPTMEERVEALEKKFERLTVLIGEDPPAPPAPAEEHHAAHG